MHSKTKESLSRLPLEGPDAIIVIILDLGIKFSWAWPICLTEPVTSTVFAS